MPLRQLWAVHMGYIEPAVRVAHRNSELCFCFHFDIMVDSAIPSPESISTVVFGQTLVLLERCGCLNLTGNETVPSLSRGSLILSSRGRRNEQLLLLMISIGRMQRTAQTILDPFV